MVRIIFHFTILNQVVMKLNLKVLRKWSRVLHRDLSYFFAGMFLIYAISGLVMNHRDTINPNYKLTQHTYKVDEIIPAKKDIDKGYVLKLLEPIKEVSNYTKHYFPEENILKVFLKGGSNYALDIITGEVVYEQIRKRPIIGAMSRLHYNPGGWWTIFADIFGIAIILITLSGLILVKGKKGLLGRGGLEVLIGILIPLVFLFF